jgi:hypothetical protein
VDDQTARCSLHGGQYQILFAREVGAAQGGPAGSPPTVCQQHPNLAAAYACAKCGAGLCATCDFPQPDGTHLCAGCAAAVPLTILAPGAEAPPVILGKFGFCLQHPRVAAVARCRSCGAAVCSTCDFVLAGNVHCCPKCATQPKKGLTPKRRKALAWAYGLAIWATLGLAVMLSGALTPEGGSKAEEEAIGAVIGFLVLIPSIIGTAMAVSAVERRLPNPPSIWGAVVWNGLLLVIFLLLAVVGTFMG